MHLQTVIWPFLHVGFGVMASPSLSGLSVHVSTGLVSLWIMTPSYQLQQAFSQGVLLLFFCFGTMVHLSLGHRTRLLLEQYDGWTLPWCLYLHIIVWTGKFGTFRHLNQTCGCPQFQISWLISIAFLIVTANCCSKSGPGGSKWIKSRSGTPGL